MSINLVKGESIVLEKHVLNQVTIGLGWDVQKGLFARTMDLDAFAFLLQDGKLKNRDDMIYYANMRHKSGAVKHHGDNLTGEGEGDDEQITILLEKIPEAYDRIIIGVNIYSAKIKAQTFKNVKNAFCRLVSRDVEHIRYDLQKTGSKSTGLLFCELYRHEDTWKMKALGLPVDGSISEIARAYQ